MHVLKRRIWDSLEVDGTCEQRGGAGLHPNPHLLDRTSFDIERVEFEPPIRVLDLVGISQCRANPDERLIGPDLSFEDPGQWDEGAQPFDQRLSFLAICGQSEPSFRHRCFPPA